jgi:hypothetical protein
MNEGDDETKHALRVINLEERVSPHLSDLARGALSVEVYETSPDLLFVVRTLPGRPTDEDCRRFAVDLSVAIELLTTEIIPERRVDALVQRVVQGALAPTVSIPMASGQHIVLSMIKVLGCGDAILRAAVRWVVWERCKLHVLGEGESPPDVRQVPVPVLAGR